MITKAKFQVIAVAFACATVIPAHSATLYNEAVSGDLSNSGLTPTVLPVSAGSNQILGTTGRTTGPVDRDYFTISVPTGLEISSIIELAGTQVGGAVSFFGVEQGSQVTVSTSATTAAGLLGWTHYTAASADTNILPAIGIPALGSAGFTATLPAGDYAFWVQDFGPGTFSYGFDVELTPTPEPTTGVTAFLLGLGLLLARRLGHLRLRSDPAVANARLHLE